MKIHKITCGECGRVPVKLRRTSLGRIKGICPQSHVTIYEDEWLFERVVIAWLVPGIRKPISVQGSRYNVQKLDRWMKAQHSNARLMCIVRLKEMKP